MLYLELIIRDLPSKICPIWNEGLDSFYAKKILTFGLKFLYIYNTLVKTEDLCESIKME